MESRKLDKAIAATEAFVRVLQAEGHVGWAHRFLSIAAHFKAGNVAAGMHNFQNTTYTGPGSLSDLFAHDQATFDRAWSECSRAVRALGRA